MNLKRFALGLSAAALTIGLAAPANATATWTFDLTSYMTGSYGTASTSTPVAGNFIFQLSLPELALGSSYSFNLPIDGIYIHNGLWLGETSGTFGLSHDSLSGTINYTADGFTGTNLSYIGSNGCAPITSCQAFSVSGSKFDAAFLSSDSSVVPVPEPATWALMFAGFGLAAVSMRRRKVAMRVSIG